MVRLPVISVRPFLIDIYYPYNCSKSNERHMKIIKISITFFFLVSSYWVTYLIFSRNFAHAGISFAVDNWTENTFMILLLSTSLSIAGIFFTGILSMFTHFIFVKLIYSDESKQAAFFYIKNRNRK